jgi:hypothetical protein
MKTNKQRRQEYMERLKESPEEYEKYKEIHRKRGQQYRIKQKIKIATLTAAEKAEILENTRIANKIRQKKSREKKKLQTAREFPYTSRKVLGKDVKKAIRALPASPRRRKVVICKMKQQGVIPEHFEKSVAPPEENP